MCCPGGACCEADSLVDFKTGLGQGHSHVSIPARLTAGAAFSSSLETITFFIIGKRLLKTIFFP